MSICKHGNYQDECDQCVAAMPAMPALSSDQLDTSGLSRQAQAIKAIHDMAQRRSVETIKELLERWRAECIAYSLTPSGTPVPKQLYLWNRIDELDALISRGEVKS